MTRWYAVPVNHHQEATAAGSILRLRLSLFFPRHLVTVSHSRRITPELRPLIPGMLFVRPMAPGDTVWIDSLDRKPGIGGLRRAAGLMSILAEQMSIFRAEFDEDGVLKPMPEQTFRGPRFRPGDRAPLVSGPMSGQDIIAEILRVDGQDRIRVLIPLLKRLVESTVPDEYLGEPLSPGSDAGGRNTAPAPKSHPYALAK